MSNPRYVTSQASPVSKPITKADLMTIYLDAYATGINAAVAGMGHPAEVAELAAQRAAENAQADADFLARVWEGVKCTISGDDDRPTVQLPKET